MFFDRFDPSDVDPRHLVGRDRDRRWLQQCLTRYLQLHGEPTGRTVCVSGEKGVGKSILTRKVLDDLKAEFSSRTLFLTVDCRSCHERRGVLRAVANEVVRELAELRRASASIPAPLMAGAQLLRTVARFDDCELRMAHEQIFQYKAATEMAGGHALLSVLKLNFGLSMEYSEKQVKSLSGRVSFDDHGVAEALIALLRDVRAHGFDAVLYLDNIDELRHEYRDSEARDSVRRDVESVLELKSAPIALILNMRKYYTGVVPREISNTRVLRPLPPETLCSILDRRLEHERGELREALRRSPHADMVQRLAQAAPTALAFLRWVKFLYEEDMLHPERVDEGFEYFLESYYSNVEVGKLQAVAEAFPTPDASLDAAAVLEACGGNRAVFEQLQDRQVILPRDFWNPTQFTLDPELHFLHPERRP